MKAVILAAGKSTRTMPLTKNIPKPLLQVLDKPLIHHTIDQVKDFVDEVIIIVGYKKELLQAYLNQNFKDIKVTTIEQREQLGTGHAIMLAKEHLGDRFLVLPGDDLFSKHDIAKIVDKRYAVLAKEVEHPERFGVLVVENNKIIDIEEKPENPKSNLISTGCWVMDKRIIELMEGQEKSKRGEYEITDALAALIKEEDVFCQVVEDYWIPISYPEDWIKANEFLLERFKRRSS